MNTEPSNTETALLLKLAKGDEEAFRNLFNNYRDRLYFFVFGITKSKEIAEDIVQDTFLKIWLRRNQLDQIINFNAYIFKVTQNAVLTALRRKATETTILENGLDAPQRESDLDEVLHFKLVKATLQNAVDSLPGQQKKVYLLRRENGQHIKEIAKTLDISEVTVKRHLNEAQKTLRRSLEKAFPLEGGILFLMIGLINW